MNHSFFHLSLSRYLSDSPFVSMSHYKKSIITFDGMFLSFFSCPLIRHIRSSDLRIRNSVFSRYIGSKTMLNFNSHQIISSVPTIRVLYLISNTIFKDFPPSSFQILNINDASAELMIKGTSFVRIHSQANLNCVHAEKAYNVTLLNVCFENCSSLQTFFGVAAHFNNIPFSTINYTTQLFLNSSHSIYYGGRTKLSTYYNNVSNSLSRAHRVGLCILNSAEGEVGGYISVSNNIGASLIQLSTSTTTTIHHINIYNNTLSGNRWFDFYQTTTYFRFCECVIICNTKTTSWIGVYYGESTIFLIDCIFDHHPDPADPKIVLSNEINGSLINLHPLQIASMQCWREKTLDLCFTGQNNRQYSFPIVFLQMALFSP